VKRLSIWLGAIVAAIVLLLIVAAIALPMLVDTPRVQSMIASQASQVMGRPVTFSSVTVSVFPLPAVVLKDLKVAEDPRFGTTPFLALDRGDLRLKLMSLLGGHVEFGDIILKKPVIAVAQDAQGRWNFASLGASTQETRTPPHQPRGGGAGAGGAGAALPALDIKLDGGAVSFSRGSGHAAQSYRVEDLDLALDTSGGMMAFKGGAHVKPGDLALKISDGRVGLQPGKTLTEATLSGKINVDGKNVKDLVVVALGPEPIVAGSVKGALTLGGTVGSPHAAGDVTLSDITVTQTNPNCRDPKQRTLKIDSVKLAVAWEESQLTARPVQTALAGGSATTNLVANLDRGMHVQARDLGIKALPLEKVLVDFLCQGYAVTGPLDLNGVLSFDARDLWNTLGGSGQLRIGPGKVVGSQALAVLGGITRVGGAISSLLAADVPQSLFTSPLDFESIAGTYQIDKGVVTTRDLTYTSRTMRIALAGTYALASGQMNFDVGLHTGRGEIQAKVTGAASSPSIRVNPTASLKGVDPGKVQGGLQDLLRRFGK
jgi:AsmA-like protein